VSCNPVEGDKKVGSVGLKFPYTDIKIIKSEKGKLVECKTDEVGEICISNPGVYAGNTYTEAEKNADLYYKKKYLRTGDLGRKDSDEYLWITGRAKDLIIRGGHNIDPAIVEEALLGHEAVAFAGAIGQPDQHSGELPCVYVELVGGAKVTPQELDEFCKEHVKEPGALPKHVEILEELPKTAVGKVFKPDLRKRAIMRVFSETLESSNVNASITSVDDDKKRGLVANISSNEDDDTINQALGGFTVLWQRASN
jgi:fatty-acyl-CoA synthase/long-chain acyl-CoA synthetase